MLYFNNHNNQHMSHCRTKRKEKKRKSTLKNPEEDALISQKMNQQREYVIAKQRGRRRLITLKFEQLILEWIAPM